MAGGSYKQNTRMIRQDQATEKAKFVQSSMLLDKYVVENGDVLLLTGPYSGYRVREVWERGEVERDYLFKNIYQRGDQEVIRIMKALFCN